MKQKIVIITSKYLHPFVEKAFEDFKEDCTVTIADYTNFDHITDIYRKYEKTADGFMISGTTAMAAIEHHIGEFQKPVISFHADLISFYHALVKLFLERRDLDPARCIFDFMLPIVKEAFLMEKEYQEECGIKSEAVVDGYRDFIFVNRFGNVQHQGTLNKALRRIIRDCNFEVLDKDHRDNAVILPKFSNHSLRHTFTTRMCEAGVNIKAMQDILGHADAETTMQIYAEATKDLKKSELINFEDYFKRILGNN